MVDGTEKVARDIENEKDPTNAYIMVSFTYLLRGGGEGGNTYPMLSPAGSPPLVPPAKSPPAPSPRERRNGTARE